MKQGNQSWWRRRHQRASFTDLELEMIAEVSIARAKERIASRHAINNRNHAASVINAKIGRINADRDMWLAAGTQSRYLEMSREANRQAHALLRWYEATNQSGGAA